MGASTFKEQNALPAVPEELALIQSNRRGVGLLNEKLALLNSGMNRSLKL